MQRANAKINNLKHKKDEWTAIFQRNVRCSTMYTKQSQASHNKEAENTSHSSKSGSFYGAWMRKTNESAIKSPSDEPVGAQQLKRPRSTEQPHFRWSEASTLFNRWRKPQKGGRDDFTRQTTIQKTDELLKEPTHRNH